MKTNSTLVLGLFLVSVTSAHALDTFNRAKTFSENLDAPANYLDKPVGRKFTSVRNLKTVLPGVLYRAGGPTGQKDISDAGLKQLCEAGFSKAFYLYPNNFRGQHTIKCTGPDGSPNEIEYVQKGFQTPADKKAILRDIYNRALNPSAGAALVHCWNGYHASGEISAVALVQFCGMSRTDATNYWVRNQPNKMRISRIMKYVEQSDLRLTTDVQSAICPR